MLRRTSLALLAFALLLAPALAEAQAKMRVTVHVIHASKKPGKIDERLKVLEKQLSAFEFRAYTLHRVQDLQLASGTAGEVELPDDRTLTVTPLARDEKGKLKVRVVIDKVVDATYNIDDGGTLIVGGPRHDDGVMILAITQASG